MLECLNVQMIIVVGLGNLGKKFEKTRHNVGFMIVESLKLKVKSFSNWKNNKKLLSEISRGEIAGQKVILAKPQTFMNESGKSVKILTNHFLSIRNNSAMARISRMFKNLWVIHDDIDLPIGKIKIIKNRGAAGHKGVQSIIDELGTKNFIRFRIGIKPKTYNLTPKTLDEFVLQKFNKKEEKILKEVIKRTCQAIEIALKEGVEKAISRFNK